MAIEPELAAMMHQTVLVAKRISQNKHGEWAYGPDVPYTCRVDYTESPMAVPTVTSSQRAGGSILARVFVSGAVVTFADVVDVHLDDRVTLDNGAVLAMLKVNHIHDESGPHHTEITA